MTIVLSGVETDENAPTAMETWKATTKTLSERLGVLYEAYMNGLINVEFDANGNVVSVSDVDEGYDFDDDDVRHGSSVC